MVPNDPSGTRFGLIALHRASIAVAAILLVLHWAAPSFKPLEIPRLSGEANLAFTSLDAGSYRSTLPRVLARGHTFEPGLTKPQRGVGPAGGDLDALSEAIRFTVRGNSSEIVLAGPAAAASSPGERAFEARGPPQATA